MTIMNNTTAFCCLFLFISTLVDVYLHFLVYIYKHKFHRLAVKTGKAEAEKRGTSECFKVKDTSSRGYN